ncbi:MAG: VacB/RNase II family 3'-5' exoribonuclease [Limnothrix sp. RL_2_0]|nr:VacB/RNase II family 3'-5' exoribonuclease [Limnothrix sp. RL_2_0]
MEKGQLIEFRLQGQRLLAVADRPEGKKDWIVIDRRGQSHKLRPQRVEYEVGGSPYDPTDIPDFLEECSRFIDPSSLEVAWELLTEMEESATPESMAQLLFSDQTPQQCYAAHGMLAEDKIFFKRKGDRYEPRPESQVREIQHQLEVEAQKEQERLAFIDRVNQAIAGSAVVWEDSDRQRFEVIERFILYPEQSSKIAQDLLEMIGRSPTTEKAFELLVSLGWWSRHENLHLLRSGFPPKFSQKVFDVAHSRISSPIADLDEKNRLDLCHLKIYTIDDESTSEIDDGLSVETLADGSYKIWVHIADPTRLITPGDELDLEARRRSTSLYLPTGMISMFPIELAAGPMSLIQGKVCAALSFGIVLTEDGAIADYEIHPTWVKPTYRLTYEDVAEMLLLGIQAEPEISLLADFAQKRSAWRKSQGSIKIKMPEASIKVIDEDVSIEVLHSSVSRELVAEMMILTGEVAGHYGMTNGLPLPFRGQPQPELPSDEELLLLPAGPVRACAVRRCMPRGEMGTQPVRHASLGLNFYTQVTSPIRRYTDLLAHFQIKAHLRGDKLPFSAEELQETLFSVVTSSQEAGHVERQTNRYWSLEYLRRNANEVWQGLVLRWLREDEKLGIILLEELGLELPHRFERAVTLGDRLEVQVREADPHKDEVRFRELLETDVAAAS